MEVAGVSMEAVDLGEASTVVEAAFMEAGRRRTAAGMGAMEEDARTADTAAGPIMATADLTGTGMAATVGMVTAGMATVGMAGATGATRIMAGAGVSDGVGLITPAGAIRMATGVTRAITIPTRTAVRRIIPRIRIRTGVPMGTRIPTPARRDISASKMETGMHRKKIRRLIHREILSRTQVRT